MKKSFFLLMLLALLSVFPAIADDEATELNCEVEDSERAAHYRVYLLNERH